MLDGAKQARTDEFRSKLAEAIAEERLGEVPEIVYPPPGAKDAAEMLSLGSGWPSTGGHARP
jgi:hypothetical protein